MFCEKCGNPLKENEKFCPKCGTPAKIPENMVKNEIAGNESLSKPETGNAVKTTQNAVSEGVAKAKNVLGNLGGEGSPLKKFLGSKYKVPGIIGGVVLLLLIVLIANGARINNLAHKVFSSPENYYQFVEKKALEDVYDLGETLYDSIVLKTLNIYDTSASSEISLELGKDGEELLELAGFAGVDLSWLKSIQGEAEVSIKDNILSMNIGTALNKDDIVSGNVIMDIENGEMYLQIPELTKTYMGIYLEDTMGSYDYRQFQEFQEQQEISKDLVKALPSQSQVKKLLKKYTAIALKCVDDVSSGSKTLKVDGIQQKYTELKVTLDADTMLDMMEAVLEEMVEDRDLEKYIVSIAEVYGEDGDEAYENFKEGIDYRLDNLDREISEDIKITMKVYVDGKGEIKGRIIEWSDYRGDKQSISILAPQKGNNVGFEFSVNADGEKVELSGSGKKSGNKVTGEYELKYNGAAILDITAKKLNTADLKKGQLNGEIGIKMSSKIGNLLNLGYSGYGSYMSMLKDLEFVINASSTKNSSKCKIEIIYDEEDIATVSASVKTGRGSKASVPSSKNVIMVEDSDDSLDWLEEIDWGKVLSRLDKTDLPTEVLDMIEYIADALEDGDYIQLYRMF